jgi:hypothetical protein
MEILSLGNAYDSTTDDIHINLDALVRFSVGMWLFTDTEA